MEKIEVTEGCSYVNIPEAGLRILCGCPENSVKFLMKTGIIQSHMENGFFCETGPNAILLSELCVQNGSFRNLAEFPILQMLYRQGMLVPGHPGNTGAKPILIGLREQLDDQASYIYHGNYGLSSVEEMLNAGISKEKAKDLFRMKLRFAFGEVKQTTELLDLRAIDSDILSLGGGVFLHREGINRYSLIRESESVHIDLNIDKHGGKKAPYSLARVRAECEDFSIIHTGEGDGWDPDHPCMGSIVMWKGEYFLIDAGPNIGESLAALGIVPTEIRGIFQTHCHDDHFVGLTELIRIDRRIEFYATPLVRKSVLRKMCALTGIQETSFEAMFDFHDLQEGKWNDVTGLEVMPCISPHPVETDIFFFRALVGKEYKSYAHLADIASFSVLDAMKENNPEKPGISTDSIEAVKKIYLTTATLKKIDAGGGMIHGNAEDFRNDDSGTIFLSHTATKLTDTLAEFCTRASFGMKSTLIKASRNYRKDQARRHLSRHLPGLVAEDLETLVSCPHIVLNEGDVLVAKGQPLKSVYLVLSGKIEATTVLTETIRNLDSGSLVGEYRCLTGSNASFNYTAVCPIEVLEMPETLYFDIVARNGLLRRITRLHAIRSTIRKSDLFKEELGDTSMDELADAVEYKEFANGEKISGDGVFIITAGEARISMVGDIVETIKFGGITGEEGVLFAHGGLMKTHSVGTTHTYFIHSSVITTKPILRWTLHEYHERRLTLFHNNFHCEWRSEFSVENAEIDAQHRELFSLVEKVRLYCRTYDASAALVESIDTIIDFIRMHAATEERLMAMVGYAQVDFHKKRHEVLIYNIESIRERCKSGIIDNAQEILEFIKSWILRHTLLVDRQYMPYLKD